MILKFEQIQQIVLKNPAKSDIEYGRQMATKLLLHLHGVGMEDAIKHCEHFATKEIWAEQKKYAMSNRDFFSRLLQQEDMIYSAQGGSSYFSMQPADEETMNNILSDMRYGLSLRKWVKVIAREAYRCDPMGIILMAQEEASVNEAGELLEPRVYPTYKSIFSIYDYRTNGRNLEYVCFRLTVSQALAFGIVDEDFKDRKASDETNYFRVIDDQKDVVVKLTEETVILATNMTQKNPLPNPWKRTPGFMVSDLMVFDKPSRFVSPLSNVVELADSFLFDRSVRELQKRYHGFAKPVEPLLRCGTCTGQGTIDGQACPHCTPPGATQGTGFKMKTKPSDVARFPLEMFEKGFDFTKTFGYVTPDIESWNKQDASLEDLEELAEMTYWGTVRMRRPSPGKTGNNESGPITATESSSNEAPKIARLNQAADWQENTENLIAWFIGKYWFPDRFKKPAITIGRDYILKSVDELTDAYLTLRTKGAPDFMLDEALERVYMARYRTNPIMLQKYLKMLDVEPFPHLSISQAQGIITDFTDYCSKLYFGEWANTVPDIKWVTTKAPALREELKTYVQAKALTAPQPEPAPVV